MVSPITFVILGFLAYLIFYYINPLYVNIYLSLIFIWVYPNISDKQAGYYLLLLILSLLYAIVKPFFSVNQAEQGSVFGFKFKGFQFFLVNVLIAIPVLLFMAYLQGSSKSQILGVVTFATFPSSLTALTPAISGSLGLIENRFLFTLVDIVKYFWDDFASSIPSLGELLLIISPISYVVLPSAFFGSLHGTAYSFIVVNILFAGIVAMIWILSYVFLDNSVVADVSHYVWNSLVAVGKTLKIVTNGGSGLNVGGLV